MIGIEANILIRYVTRDGGKLAARADRVLEKQCTPDKPGFVTVLALAKMFWTLKSAYGYERKELANIIEACLNAQELVFEHSKAVWYALDCYRNGFDFTDALIGHIGAASGCETTLTLDKKATHMSEFSSA